MKRWELRAAVSSSTVLWAAWLAMAAGCPAKTDGKEADAAPKTDEQEQPPPPAAADGADEAGADGAGDDAVGPTEISLSPDAPPAACTLLPAAIAASTLDVPEAELRQVQTNGCAYSKTSTEEEASVSLTGVLVAATPEAASTRFAGLTKSMTRKEVAEIAANAAAAEKAEAAGETEGPAADDRKAEAVKSRPMDIQFEDVAGIGDEARLNMATGTLTVRAGNLLFSVTAYKGARMTPPKTKAGSDVAKVAEATRKARAKYVADTMDTRKDLAAKTAEAIIAGLG